MTDKATQTTEPGGSPLDGGVRPQAWAAYAVDAIGTAFGFICFAITLRTLAPADLEWWQGAAMGGASMILARIWMRLYAA